MIDPVLGMTLSLDERGLPVGSETRTHLVIEVVARGPGVERARPPMSVVLAVDVSGSMAGPPIEQVIQSIDRVAALLDPTDRIGVAAFSDRASEVAPLADADVAARRLVSSRARRLVAEGGTNIEAGLRKAAEMMPARRAHERQVILLLSDGAPNRGLATPKDLGDLARSLRPHIGVSTLGYGAQHNEDMLGAISEGGAGRYHFIADPSMCEIEFAQAIGAQGDVVAESVEIALTLEPGVEISRFLGTPRVRFGASGLRIDAPDLLEGSRHSVVAELSLRTPRDAGAWPVARATLSYKRAGDRETSSCDVILRTIVGMEDRMPEPAARARVLVVRADEVRAEARALADRGQFEGAGAVIRRFIASLEAERWFTAGDGSPLSEAVEQMIDDAVAMERKPSAEAYKVFRKTQMGVSVSADDLAHSVGPMSVQAMASVGGVLPRAHLVIRGSGPEGTTVPLVQPRAVIGRTMTADIQVPSRLVSRKHAMITGVGGRYLVTDLGSSSPTEVNGRPIDKPHSLSPGDVIRVGDVDLRYEETER